MKKILVITLFISFKIYGQSVSITPSSSSHLNIFKQNGTAQLTVQSQGNGGNSNIRLQNQPNLHNDATNSIDFNSAYSIRHTFQPELLGEINTFGIYFYNKPLFFYRGFGSISTSALELLDYNQLLTLWNRDNLEENVENSIIFRDSEYFTGAIKTIGTSDHEARLGLFSSAASSEDGLKERLTILNNGKVGIGNSTPSLNSDERMEINGRLRIRDSTETAGVWFNNSANGIGIDNGAFVGLENNTSGSERAGIWIGSAWRFSINRVGNANFTGTVTATGFPIASDFRYKKNIQTLQNTLSKVQKIVGVSYDLRKDEFPEKNFSDKPQIGFIAQDLEKIFPEMVFTDEKGYKSVDYARLTPVLVEALKELILKNQTLESRLDKIEALLSTIPPNTENSNSKR